MTIRATIFGLLGALFVCGYTYFNDAVLRQTMFVGNTMPLSVYGGLLFFVLAVNPLLRYLRKRWAFTGAELALALVITLAACCIPGSGLLRTFTSTLIMPRHYERLTPGWHDNGVLDHVPRKLLVEIDEDQENIVLDGFVQGLGDGRSHIAVSDVPWRSWIVPLVFWLPLILTLWVGQIGLSLVTHTQWSEHERLPYPVARFANEILPDSTGAPNPVLRSPAFWLALCGVFVIHLNNYSAAWFPDQLIPVQLSVNLWPLAKLFKSLQRGGAWFFFRPRLFFTPIAFAYFLASDVSLSLGLGPILYSYLRGRLREVGISLTSGSFFAPKPQTFIACGAYLGLLASMLYTGRRFYSSVAARMVWLRRGDRVPVWALWGARVFVLSVVLMVVQLAFAGMDWQLALLYTAGLVLVFLVMSRVIAESGLFFLQAWWFPGVIMLGFFGPAALGPKVLVTMLLLSSVLALDTREAFMPYMVNSLKLIELRRIRPGRASSLCVLALVLGLGIGVPLVLYLQYDLGANLLDRWGNYNVPRFAFSETLAMQQTLEAQGTLETSLSTGGWQRFADCAPQADLLGWLLFGAALVLVISFLRLRFPKFPLHPVLFIIWHTYPGMIFCASFIVGWLIKSVVTKYGGPRLYMRLKPFMLGLVAGEMSVGIVLILIGTIYHFITGELPKTFTIMPG